jgi:hypothetical protein
MQITLDRILEAKTASDLFGSKDNKDAPKVYKRGLHVSHPDMYPLGSPDAKKAEKAFIKLSELWSAYNGKVEKEGVIKTKKREYVLGEKLYDYDGFVIYQTTYDAGNKNCILTFSKSVKKNELVDNYKQKLNNINKDVNPDFAAFYPVLLESFRFSINGEVRNIITYEQPEGFYSLAQVLEDYPEGINGRDIAWIFKRVLAALGNAHEIGIIHGAVNLNSILIHPEQHGLILTNWQYAVEDGKVLKFIPPTAKALYPQYVFDKKEAHKELDFYLAAETMELLFRDDMPKTLRAFFKGCKLASMPDAPHLLAEFDDVLKKTYGAPKFHVFKMRTK